MLNDITLWSDGENEPLGNLHIHYQYHAGDKKPDKYRRELSLNNAVSRTSFILDDVKYTREYFSDFKRDVMVIRLYASEIGKLNFHVDMDHPQEFASKLDGDDLVMRGQTKEIRYITRIRIRISGAGKLTDNDGKLHVTGAQEAMIIVSAATDYKDDGYEAKCTQLLNYALIENKYTTIKAQHTEVFRDYFDRASLNLTSHTRKDTIPIDRRLTAFIADPNDNGLAELCFQYGRYLLISNMLSVCPPFRIDGHLSGCSDIADMLIQRRTGVIELLPALPEAWDEGVFDGLNVGGDAELSAAWKDHRLTSALLKATADNTFKVKIPDYAKNVTFEKNRMPMDAEIMDGIIELTLKKDETVQVRIENIDKTGNP